MADLENSKWPPQKNSFSSSANSQYFFMKFLQFGPWLVELIDAKGIDVAQLIWS